jgi:uncharacterized protein (UPF0332 family)
MAFPDELLLEALKSVQSDLVDEPQGRLRRAVSTAYYGLFHLLIDETVANWSRPEQREKLSRAFAHKQMRNASDQVRGRPYAGETPDVVTKLRHVAESFVNLQQSRIEADYDKSKPWTQVRALSKVKKAQQAFANVDAIRSEPIFQDYLLSLFVHEWWEEVA